jgi:glycosyltransferase involved in cell wall biosynthesis
MTAWPDVSVIVPTRGRGHVLGRALGSVLGQRYEGRIECIVVFDQEEPAAPELEVPAGRELRVMVNDRTPGVAGARNTGVLAATGDLVAFCDDDDEWLGDKLREQVEALRGYPEAAVSACGIYVESRDRTFVRVPGPRLVTEDYLLSSRRQDVHSTALVARHSDFLHRIGLFDEEIPNGYGEDYDWLLRAAHVAPIVAVQVPLARIHWDASWFADRWETIIAALEYQLRKHPELRRWPGNVARMYGRIAFAHAALGHGHEARRWARRSLAANWREPRGYLAVAISLRLLSARTAVRLAHRRGRGI